MKTNKKDEDKTRLVDDLGVAEDDIYSTNDTNKSTQLINDDKQLSKSVNNEHGASTSSHGSAAGKSHFGISTTRNCPTCNGIGKVKKNEQHQLVALIPLSDNRLKPKRIWLWILSTFIVCLVIASTLTFLLAPRTISISNKLVDLHPFNITKITDPDNNTIGINLSFQEIFEIHNANFFQVKMKNLTLELNRISHLVAPKIIYNKDTPIDARESTNVSVNVTYIMYSETDPYVDLCDKGVINELFALMTTTFQFSTLWSADVEVQLKNTQYLYCRFTNSTIPHHMNVAKRLF
jgi:hypothetical protein